MSDAILLDTSVLFWAVFEPGRLTREVQETLGDIERPVVVSAVSPWELAIKHRLGKLPDAAKILAGFGGHVRRLRAELLPITAEHGIHAGGLEWKHRDPFDRMLVAQSQIEGLTLVTSDRAIRELSGVRTLW